jgi:hypothetical protein
MYLTFLGSGEFQFTCAERERAKREDRDKNRDVPAAMDELENPSLSMCLL